MSGFLTNPAGSAPMTGAAIKVAYESQPDTNEFTDAEKTKLGQSSVFTAGEKTKLGSVARWFSDVAEMVASAANVTGDVVVVASGYNGESETFSIVADGTHATADGKGVVALTGISGQAVSSRVKFNSFADFTADGRPFANGRILTVAGVGDFEAVSAGAAASNAGGQGFVPSGTVTPFHFGCVEEPEGTYGGTDQSAKVQAFFDYINANALTDVNWTGAFSIANPVTLGATSEVKTMYCRGRLFLRAMVNLPGSVFRVDRLRADSIWGDLNVDCLGGADYAIRQTPVAIELGNISRAKLGTWRGRYAQIWGVWCTTEPGVKNSNLIKADKLMGWSCGSGYSLAGRSHTGTIGSKIDYGTAGSTSQATRISVANVGENSPAALANYGIEGATDPFVAGFAANDSNPKFVEIAGRLYHVIFEDRAGFNFWVYPRVPASVPDGTAFRWIFGGGVGFFGGDSNVAEIGIIEAASCGIGVSFGMLYGPKVGMLLTDAVGIAAHIGGNTGNSCFGTRVDSHYIEGADHHIVTSSIDCDFEIGNTFALDIGKIKTTVNPSDAAGNDTKLYPPIQKGRVSAAGIVLENAKQSNNAVGSTHDFTIDRANKHDVIKIDTVTVNLALLDHINEVTGVDSGLLTVIGTGVGSAPTEITFDPPAGHSVNGGAADATAVFSTFTKPGHFKIMLDIANSNWLVVGDE
ncbi:hypothetical protein WG622_02550 [Cognatishimia sp. D5M38]|uniref:Uncharacterized protein n=1 Tax=Cognatishimia coralii TaxID=3083254 RepID=A0ABU8QCF1_9RHOB